VSERETNVSVTWTYGDSSLYVSDQFQEVSGPKTRQLPQNGKKKVLKEFDFTGQPGDKLKVFLSLYAGNIQQHVARLNAVLKSHASTTQASGLCFWVSSLLQEVAQNVDRLYGIT
jgi:hypothetical protein